MYVPLFVPGRCYLSSRHPLRRPAVAGVLTPPAVGTALLLSPDLPPSPSPLAPLRPGRLPWGGSCFRRLFSPALAAAVLLPLSGPQNAGGGRGSQARAVREPPGGDAVPGGGPPAVPGGIVPRAS